MCGRHDSASNAPFGFGAIEPKVVNFFSGFGQKLVFYTICFISGPRTLMRIVCYKPFKKNSSNIVTEITDR